MKKSKKPHDEKTCFRCRLHALYEEIGCKHDNNPQFMLISMAEACGDMLSQLGFEDMILFLTAIKKFTDDKAEEHKWETRH
jgi:hypothetical protein